jgi:hypothetical protein
MLAVVLAGWAGVVALGVVARVAEGFLDAAGSTATTPPRNDRVGYVEATTTLESMTIWLTRF